MKRARPTEFTELTGSIESTLPVEKKQPRIFASSRVSVDEATDIVEGFLDFYTVSRQLVVNWNMYRLPSGFKPKANVIYYQIHDTKGFYEGKDKGVHNIASVTYNGQTAVNDSIALPKYGEAEGWIPYSYFPQQDSCSCGYSASMFVIYCVCLWVKGEGKLNVARLPVPPVNLFPVYKDSAEYALRHLQMSFYSSCHHYKALSENPLGIIPELRYRFTIPKFTLALAFDKLDPSGNLARHLAKLSLIKDPDVAEFIQLLAAFWFLYDRRALVLLEYMDEKTVGRLAESYYWERAQEAPPLPWQVYTVLTCERPPKPAAKDNFMNIPATSSMVTRLCEYTPGFNLEGFEEDETLSCWNPERTRSAKPGTFDALVRRNDVKKQPMEAASKFGVGSAGCQTLDFKGDALWDIVQTYGHSDYLFLTRFYEYRHLIAFTRLLLSEYKLLDESKSGIDQPGQEAVEDFIGLGSCAACRAKTKPIERIVERQLPVSVAGVTW